MSEAAPGVQRSPARGVGRPAPSWPVATWVVPVVPTVAFWTFVVVGSRTRLADEETRGALLAAAVAALLLALGLLLARARGPRTRGLGLGVVAGAAVTVPMVLLMAAR
jgi:hypothetical protein